MSTVSPSPFLTLFVVMVLAAIFVVALLYWHLTPCTSRYRHRRRVWIRSVRGVDRRVSVANRTEGHRLLAESDARALLWYMDGEWQVCFGSSLSAVPAPSLGPDLAAPMVALVEFDDRHPPRWTEQPTDEDVTVQRFVTQEAANRAATHASNVRVVRGSAFHPVYYTVSKKVRFTEPPAQ